MRKISVLSLFLIAVFFGGLASVQAQSCTLPVGLHDDSNSCISYTGLLTQHNTGVSGYLNGTNTETSSMHVIFEGAGAVLHVRRYPQSPGIYYYFYSDDFPDLIQAPLSTSASGDAVGEIFLNNVEFGEWYLDIESNQGENEDNVFIVDAIEILDVPSTGTIDFDLSPLFSELSHYLPTFIGIFAIIGGIAAAIVLGRWIISYLSAAFSGRGLD